MIEYVTDPNLPDDKKELVAIAVAKMAAGGRDKLDVDDARVVEIAHNLAGIVSTYATLRSRTDKPVWLRLIEPSKRWWILWLAVGLTEEACGEIEEVMAEVGNIEYEIADVANAVGGRDVYNAFVTWATAQDVGFIASDFIDGSPAWEEPSD